jgi:hypothetical protein
VLQGYGTTVHLVGSLIENHGDGHIRGEPNAWTLTERGEAIHTAITVQDPAV